MNALRYILVVCLLFGMGSVSWAATFGVAVMDASGNIVSASDKFKTPPLRTSDTFRVVIDKHFSAAMAMPNWAGYRIKFHVIDGKEVSVLPTSTFYKTDTVLTPAGGTTLVLAGSSPLVPTDFPQSAGATSLSVFKTWFNGAAQNSGKTPPISKWMPVAGITLHAKNTDIGENSDFDLSVMAWCIRHLRPGQGSTQFEESALVWASSHYVPQRTDQGNLVLPQPYPPDYPGQHWVHIPFPWHVPVGFPGSQFIATFAGTVFIGLEHVPEPMTGVLAGGGVLLLLGSWGLRRRRMAV